MKRLLIVLVLLILAVGGYFLAAHLMGGALPTFGLPIGGESATVRKQALAFVEDLHFRDLNKASQAFAPAEQNVDAVQAFLQRVFNASADQLDLTECTIDNVELDSTSTRARVKLKVKAKNLTTGKVLQSEILIFFRRGKPDDRWYLVTQ